MWSVCVKIEVTLRIHPDGYKQRFRGSLEYNLIFNIRGVVVHVHPFIFTRERAENNQLNA